MVGTVSRAGLVGLVVVRLVGAVGPSGVGAVSRDAYAPHAGQAQKIDVTGKWRMSLDMEMGHATPLLELEQNEGKLTGTYQGRYGASPVSGTTEGRTFKFGVAMETMTLQFRGEVLEDGTLKGTADFGEMGSARWTAAREQ